MAKGRGGHIAISGIDGAGKSTQIGRLVDHYAAKGTPTIVVWSRGGYTPRFLRLKAAARRLVPRAMPPPGRSQAREKAMGRQWVRRTWLYLSIADLAWEYGVRVRLLKWSGRVVISDRYLWDTWIDFKLNFPADDVERTLAWRVLRKVAAKPDLSVLLHIPYEEALRRCEAKKEPFPEDPAKMRERLGIYEGSLRARYDAIVDALPAEEVVSNDILRRVASNSRLQ